MKRSETHTSRKISEEDKREFLSIVFIVIPLLAILTFNGIRMISFYYENSGKREAGEPVATHTDSLLIFNEPTWFFNISVIALVGIVIGLMLLGVYKGFIGETPVVSLSTIAALTVIVGVPLMFSHMYKTYDSEKLYIAEQEVNAVKSSDDLHIDNFQPTDYKNIDLSVFDKDELGQKFYVLESEDHKLYLYNEPSAKSDSTELQQLGTLTEKEADRLIH